MKGVCALTLVLTALVVAACGGTSTDAKNDYVNEVNAAQNAFAQNVTSVSQAITTESSPKEDRETLKKFEQAIDDVVQDLEDIDVPEDVKVEHQQLVDAMSGFGNDIAQATAALDNPTTRTLERAHRRIQTATQNVNGRINAAIEAINDKLRDS